MDHLIRNLASAITCSIKLPFTLAFAIDLLSNIQTIYLALKTTFAFNVENKGPLLWVLGNILDFLQEKGSIEAQSQPYIVSALLGYFIAYISILILLIMFQIYKNESSRYKLLKILATLHIIHSRVACSVINYLLVQIFSFQYKCDSSIQDIHCDRTWFILGLSICVFNITLALVQEFFLFSVIKNRNSYAMKSNVFFQVILLQKTLAIFLEGLITDIDIRNQVTSTLNFILISFASSILYIKLPFYDMKILKENIVMTTIAIISSLVSLLRVIGLSQEKLEVAWVFLTLLAVKIYLACLNQLFYKILRGNFDTPERAIHFIILLKQTKFGYIPPVFLKEKFSFKSFVVNGTLLQNNRSLIDLKRTKSTKDYENRIYLYIIVMLEKTMTLYPKSELLILFLAQIYLKKLKNIPKTIALLKTYESYKGTIWANNSLEDFRNKFKRIYMKEYILNGDQDALNVVKYFDCRTNTESIKHNMLSEVQKHLEFWEEITKEQVDVKAVTTLARQIDSLSKIIAKKEQYDGNCMGAYFSTFFALFAVYVDTIQESPQDAKKYTSRLTNLNHGHHFGSSFDVHSDNQAAVVLPIEKGGFGKILDASGSAQGVFNMKKDQIIDKPLNVLLPYVITNHLFKIADESLGGAAAEKLSSKFTSYAKTQNGGFFEVEIEIRLHPELEKEVKVMIFFRKISSPKLIMIVDPNGSIVECAEKLHRAFNLPKNYAFSTRLQDIVLDYQRINTIYKFSSDDNAQTDNRFASPKRPVPIKTQSSGVNRKYIMNFEETSKTQQGISAPGSPRSSSPELREHNLSLNLPNKPISTNQADNGKASDLDRPQNTIRFVPLNGSFDARSSLTFNIEVRDYIIDPENYKVISLIPESELKGISNGSNETRNRNYSPQDEENLDGEGSPIVGQKVLSNVHKVMNTKEGADKSKNDLLSPTSNHPLISKHKKNKSSIALFTKKPYSRDRRRSSMKEKLTERESSISSSSSSKSLLSIKALRNLFNHPSSSSLKVMSLSFYIIVIFLACLGGLNLYFSQRSLDQINAGIMIINYATLRLSESMRGWQLATRFFIRHVKLRTGGSIATLKSTIADKGIGMVKMNKRLSQEISSQVQADLLDEIFKRDLDLWELNQSTKFTDNRTDTFVATKLLGSKMVFIGNTTLNYELPSMLDEIQYVVNNTCNDYLISSEKLVTVTQHMLQSIIQDNIITLQIMLGAESVALIILCLFLMLSAKKVFGSYQRLFQAITKIDQHQIEYRIGLLQQLKEVLMENIETKQFVVDAFNVLNRSDWAGIKSGNENQHRRKSELSFKGFVLHLAKVITISLITIQTITGLSVASLSQSITNFRSLEKINNQLYVTTKAGYRVTMVIGVFYTELTFRNQTTMLIRNEAPRVQLAKTLNELRQVNNDLASVFDETGTGITDPFIKDLLEHGACKYLTKDVQTSCRSVAQTSEKDMGIFDFNSKLLQLEEYFIDLHFSNPTYANAKSFVETYATIMRPTVDTLDQAYDILNSYIIQLFTEEKEVYLAKTTYFYVGILASLAVSLLAIQCVSMKELKSLDACRGYILRTVSCKILLENKAMKFYLSRHFINKMVKLY